MKLDLVTGSPIIQDEAKKEVKPVDPTPFLVAFSCAALVGVTATMGYFYATSDYHSGNDSQPTVTESTPTFE